MPTISFNKLVRDRIPEIILESGKACVWEVLPDDEYIEALNMKLLEEVNEYLETGSTEELADIIEVIKAISEYKGIREDAIEDIRINKLETRGGFKKRIILRSVDE